MFISADLTAGVGGHFGLRQLLPKPGLDMAKQGTSETDPSGLSVLMSRCAEGDHSAFEALYHATKGKIFATVLLILKRRDLAEEVVQEAYVRIWTKASTFDPLLGSPIAWMASIARNLAINIVRRPEFEQQAEEAVLQKVPAGGYSVLEEMVNSQDAILALNALEEIDPMCRRLIVAAYLYGESREVLSKRFGIPVNTVKTWIRRGLLATRVSLSNAEGSQRNVA